MERETQREGEKEIEGERERDAEMERETQREGEDKLEGEREREGCRNSKREREIHLYPLSSGGLSSSATVATGMGAEVQSLPIY